MKIKSKNKGRNIYSRGLKKFKEIYEQLFRFQKRAFGMS
jgi:hypothetical protein